ncbi:MAG: hypothetical protein ACXWCG_08090 [Flavitalea sp.]
MTKYAVPIFTSIFLQDNTYAQLHDSIIRNLKRERLVNHTRYIYWLQFEAGRNDNTGYSAFPHSRSYVHVKQSDFQTVATRFYTTTGVCYLHPRKFYKTTHQ